MGEGLGGGDLWLSYIAPVMLSVSQSPLGKGSRLSPAMGKIIRLVSLLWYRQSLLLSIANQKCHTFRENKSTLLGQTA